MLDREQDHLLQLFFGFLETSYIFPLDVWDLNVGLSQGSRVDCGHGKFKVFLGDCHGFQNLSIYLFSLNIDDIHFLSDALQSRLSAKGSNVGSYEAVGFFGNCLEIYVFSQFHVFGVNPKDLESAYLIRDAYIDFAVKPAEASQGWVDGVGPIGGSNHNHVASTFESVHKSQHLRYHTSLNLTMYLLSIRGN